jgi:hypothetical protein
MLKGLLMKSNADVLLERLDIMAKMALKQKNVKEAHKVTETQLNFILALRRNEPLDPRNWTSQELEIVKNYAISLMEEIS